MEPVILVFLYGLVTALATGFGAVPFAFVRQLSPRITAQSNAVASGLMLGASFGLVAEGTQYGGWQTIVGGIGGVLFILVTHAILKRYDLGFGGSRGVGARRALLMIVVMTVHSFAEGVAVGVSFGGGMTLALVIVIAIAVHNVPEGLAISAVMRPRGTSVLACATLSVVSSLPQPIMAVPAFLLVDTFTRVLPYGIGFAAGAMVFMVIEELLPEAYGQDQRHGVAITVSVTMLAMVIFQQYL